MKDSRIRSLYRLPVAERILRLAELGWLSSEDAARLRDGHCVLSVGAADHMIENVVGVFGLPLAVAPNFVVNDRECIVPLVVEEPSIVAGLSAAASLTRASGGFTVENEESLLIGQVHVTGMGDPDHALAAIAARKPALLEAANAVHPRLVARGGGVRDIETRLLALRDGAPVIAVHLLVDTGDAMGANLVNTVCEALAPDIAAACDGRVALRILSNFADRSLFTARATFTVPDDVGDAIILANDIARIDPYRAATHNKGVMNGVDALALATGNDWRAVEAGAHAYAAAAGHYRALTRWGRADEGLCGEITLPLKVGTVGGTLASNPAAALGLALTGARTARQLAELMAAVGLAQNFAALRALVTQGIQAGHMKLHARSVAASAGATGAEVDDVVGQLIHSGEVKSWKAREILDGLRSRRAGHVDGRAAGKVILLGEHGVVYGRHALALPLPDAVRVTLSEASGLSHDLPEDYVACLLNTLGVTDAGWRIDLDTRLPIGKGLGSSAAIAVAIARAFNARLGLGLDDAGINAVAFESEKLAHGSPSGIDNTLATFAEPMLFRNAGNLHYELVAPAGRPPLIVAWGDEVGRTSDMVAGVRERRARAQPYFESLFDAMDRLSRDGAGLLAAGDWTALGRLMNICQGLLNAIGVSTPQLERMIGLARQSGAAGAKLTGAGGGGSIVALCPGSVDEVDGALRHAGYSTFIPGTHGDS
ncbi:MAG: hydroxymethylglutaryl-CoA reductase, degradative [Woeseiaceae bacterium]